MSVSEEDKIGIGNRNENSMNYHPPSSMPSEWQIGSVDVASSHLGFIPADSQMVSCASATVVNSFGQALWDQSSGLNMGVHDINVQNTASTSNLVGIREGDHTAFQKVVDRTMGMGLNPPYPMVNGGIFLQDAPGMLPQSLSQFPADPAFIERAARYSCFNTGNFGDVVNPFGPHLSTALCSRDGDVVQGPNEVSTVGLRTVSSGHSLKNAVAETSSAFPSPVGHVGSERSPPNVDRKSESLVRSHDEAKQGLVGSCNDSGEAESSGRGGVARDNEQLMLDGNHGDTSARSHDSKKRKRNIQAKESPQAVEAATNNSDIPHKVDQNPTSTTNKTSGKQGKHGSQASDPPKEEYIHVRARRGQATNSHSLAERVRREKISERMKLLQDLVPGCSKVTGKAVMLDEIINYVQSLQRQVEFLSMKLATVNPRLDQNIEGLLAKDILQSRPLSLSSLASTPEMPLAYPPMHLPQPGLIQPAFPNTESHSDVMRGAFSSHLAPLMGGLKEATQVPNVWGDELNNVLDMSYGTAALQDGHDPNGQLATEHMKAER